MNPPDWAVTRAIAEAVKSPCQSKRGVVVWSRVWTPGVTVSEGYNRPPLPLSCNGSDECKKTCSKTAVHAEQNALLNILYPPWEMEMLHVKVVEGKLVPSGNPSCLECSKLILEKGIRGMWLYHEEGWRRYGAEEFHLKTLEHHGLTAINCTAVTFSS